MCLNVVMGNAPFVVPIKRGPAMDITIGAKQRRVGTLRHTKGNDVQTGTLRLR